MILPVAISRLIELGVPAFLIRATVRGVMSQRLVRTLCHQCKRLEAADSLAWLALVGNDAMAMPEQLYRPIRVQTLSGNRLFRSRGHL